MTAKLPTDGDRIWYVFHGVVGSGRVVRVEPPGQSMAHAAIFVSDGRGVTCLHGVNPSIREDTERWYWSEREARAVAAEEKASAQRLHDRWKAQRSARL